MAVGSGDGRLLVVDDGAFVGLLTRIDTVTGQGVVGSSRDDRLGRDDGETTVVRRQP